MTESAESDRPTLVKPRSTWVITSKTSPVNPIEPLDQVSTHPWSTLGQRHGQTPLKNWCRRMSSGTFAAFSKFHRNTSNSTKIKVVQFVEEHNFHVGWHFKFWAEKGEKLGQLQFSLFISTLQNPDFASRSCSNRPEKHRTTFTKVVEGCLIYNFRIYRFLSHSSTFWRKMQSKSRWPAEKQLDCGPERRRRARCSAGASCAARRAQGSRATSASVRARSPPPRGQGRGPLRACRPWNASRIFTASYRSEVTTGP
jgi:hypothetical protein